MNTICLLVGALRVDPHPAWDRTYTGFALNACPTGTRRVYVVDVPPELLGQPA